MTPDHPDPGRPLAAVPEPAGEGETAPLRFEDGALLLLDQRRLPAEEAWLRCESAEEVAQAIERMAVRGAPAIGLAASYGLALAVRGGGDAAELRKRFEAASRRLAATRPTAVNLKWSLDRARAAFEEALASDGAERVPDALLASAHSLGEQQLAADRRLAELGAERFGAGERVLTHCNTGPLATGGYGTAGGILRAAWQAGRLAQVWVDETRPLLQGARLTAWELAREGIPFRLVTDSSVGALMARGEVDRVVVGADRIARNGDVANKVGTYPIAVMAARHGVPFLVAAPLSTVDPDTPDGASIPIEERSPEEVTGLLDRPISPPGTAAVNFSFDVTPAELVTAIVTEAAILEPPFERSIARVLDG